MEDHRSARTVTRHEALSVLAEEAEAKFENINVPVVIREALRNTEGCRAEGCESHDRVLHMIGVVCDAPMGTFVPV